MEKTNFGIRCYWMYVMKAQFELKLSSCWVDFSQLWNINKERLRMGFVNGQNTKQTKKYNKEINKY